MLRYWYIISSLIYGPAIVLSNVMVSATSIASDSVKCWRVSRRIRSLIVFLSPMKSGMKKSRLMKGSMIRRPSWLVRNLTIASSMLG